MDLASYLLKPMQRMGKYALLLQQLMKIAKGDMEHLRQAESMVRFQLRHGNDLLTTDSLRECDVNLKEQDRLLRQNESSCGRARQKRIPPLMSETQPTAFNGGHRGADGDMPLEASGPVRTRPTQRPWYWR